MTNNSPTGTSGVAVVPSDAITTAPVFVNSTESTVLGIAPSVTLAGGLLRANSPGVMMYLATGTDSKQHLYGLNLLSASMPVPSQVSSLSLNTSAILCNYNQAQRNLLDPATLFLVVQVSDANGSCVAGVGWQIIQYSDSATTAPAAITITPGTITPLYQPSGALSGLLARESSTNSLNFYATTAFTNPIQIATGVTSGNVMFVFEGQGNTAFAGSVDFVTASSTTAGITTTHLYRVKYDGTFMDVYTTNGFLSGAVVDDTYLYFTDISATGSVAIKREPLTGSTTVPTLYSSSTPWELVGSNGSQLVMQALINYNGSTFLGALATIATTAPSTSVTYLGGTVNRNSNYNALVEAFMVPTSTDGSFASNAVIVNLKSINGTGTAATVASSTEVILPNGTVKQGLLNNSVFLRYDFARNFAFQITGITSESNNLLTYGGGELSVINLANLTATPMKNANGTPYIVPAGNLLGLSGLSLIIGSGVLNYVLGNSSDIPSNGVALDVSQSLIVPISVVNSNVYPY